MRLCRLQFTSVTGHMLRVFWHSISIGSFYESKLGKHVAEPHSVLLAFLQVWPAVNVNRTVGFGMQTFAHMQLEQNNEVNPLWTTTRFQNRLTYPQFKQFQKIHRNVKLLNHCPSSGRVEHTIYTHSHSWKENHIQDKIHYRSQSVLRYEKKRLTGSLETITGWQISGAFISKNLSQLFTSSSVFRGQAENSGG